MPPGLELRNPLEDLLDRFHSRVVSGSVRLPSVLLVPVEDLRKVRFGISTGRHSRGADDQGKRGIISAYTTAEWRDKGDTGLGASDSLGEAEEKSEVAARHDQESARSRTLWRTPLDPLLLQLLGGFDPLESGANLRLSHQQS